MDKANLAIRPHVFMAAPRCVTMMQNDKRMSMGFHKTNDPIFYAFGSWSFDETFP